MGFNAEIYKTKLFLFASMVIFFAFLYCFYDDTHFSGINTIQELLRSELLRQKLKEKGVIEQWVEGEDKEKELKSLVQTIKDEVEDHVDHMNYIKFFLKRLYFSLVTGSSIGYGDIYPATSQLQVICGLQMIAVCAIILM